MSAGTAKIVALKGSTFSFTSTSGSIQEADFNPATTGTASVDVPSSTVSVSNLPAGDSTLWLTIIWDPDAPNGSLQIVKDTNPPLTYNTADFIRSGKTPAPVTMFGK
jgi:hypothetical protein